jgi:hypothetical protein
MVGVMKPYLVAKRPAGMLPPRNAVTM